MNDSKIVEVHWIDASSEQGWYDMNQYKNLPLKVTSIGYLVRETEEIIIISSSCGPFDLCTDPMTIPKIAIIKMWSIEI